MPKNSPVESVFFAALALAPGDRSTFLDGACRGDTGLRVRVEKMLAAQSDLGDFLDQPVVATVTSSHAVGRAAGGELSGAMVGGRYELLEQIGEGGMGTVWRANQLSPVRRQVAVKLIRSEHTGSRGLLARFEAERQAIARMDHPYIAKLLDAGATTVEPHSVGGGRLYFVMELVDGAPINDYCDAHNLTVSDRLRLFVQLCRAVQHAHQKGIIHRDLKPSNILVEHHDGRPVPRVIDFGLAKATGGARLPDETLFTRPGNVAGTPLYMAPEQADLHTTDIDTRADVYALGVNLYELLTGTTPIERERLKKVPLPDLLHVIRDTDSPPPSKRLNSTDRCLQVATHRQTEPARLGRLVRGELDWIVMKALAKERDQRYETVAALAGDVERFLNQEPVLAGPPGATYRLKKFVRRNRVQVTAAGLLLLALVAGTAGTTFGLIRAEYRREEAEYARRHEAEQRERAETAQSREAEQRERAVKGAGQTRAALDALTLAATGSTLDEGVYVVRDRRFLAQALPYYQELAAEPADDEASRARVAGATLRVGTIQYSLAQHMAAEVAFLRSVDLYTGLVADFPSEPEYCRHLVTSHDNLGYTLAFLNKPEAMGQHLKSFAVREKMAADFPKLPWCRQSLALGHRWFAKRLDAPNPLTPAEHAHRAVAILEELAAEFPDNPAYRQDLANALEEIDNLGPPPREVEALYRRAMTIQAKLAADHPTVGEYRHVLARRHRKLAFLLFQEGRKAESEEQFRAGGVVWEKLIAEFPAEPNYREAFSEIFYALGRCLIKWGKRSEGEKEFRRAVATQKGLCALFPGNDHYRAWLAIYHESLGRSAVDRGAWSEGEVHYREVVAYHEQLLAQFADRPQYQASLANSSCNLGLIVRESGRPGESLVWFEKAIPLAKVRHEQNPNSVTASEVLSTIHRCRAVAYHRLGKNAEAEKEWGRAFELIPRSIAVTPPGSAPDPDSSPLANSVYQMEADIAALCASEDWGAGHLYRCACAYARGTRAWTNPKNPGKKKELADRAMELFRRAVKAGFTDADKAEAGDLGELRDRDDFKKLLADLRKK